MSRLMVPGLSRPNQTEPSKKTMRTKAGFCFVGSLSLSGVDGRGRFPEVGSCDMRISWRRYMTSNWSSGSSYGALTSHAAIVVF